MAFKLKLSDTYTTPVVVDIPASGGKFDRVTFDAEFRRVGREELNNIYEEMREPGKTDLDLLHKVLVGWKGVQDEDGEELPFSEDAKDAVFDIPQVVPALVKTFYASISKVKEKN